MVQRFGTILRHTCQEHHTTDKHTGPVAVLAGLEAQPKSISTTYTFNMTTTTTLTTPFIPYDVTAHLTLPHSTITTVVEAGSPDDARTSAFTFIQNILILKGSDALVAAYEHEFRTHGFAASLPLPCEDSEETRLKAWGTVGLIWNPQPFRNIKFDILNLTLGGFSPQADSERVVQISFQTIDSPPTVWIRTVMCGPAPSDVEVGLISMFPNGSATVTLPNRTGERPGFLAEGQTGGSGLGRSWMVPNDTFKTGVCPWVQHWQEFPADMIHPVQEQFRASLDVESAEHKSRRYRVAVRATASYVEDGFIEATSVQEAMAQAEDEIADGQMDFLEGCSDEFLGADEWSVVCVEPDTRHLKAALSPLSTPAIA
jgi:hypothetical protein